jgi:multicomponent Na+:H+ antiporter subunit A
MIWLIAFHVLLGTGILLGRERLRARGMWLGALGPLATAVWAARHAPGILAGEPVAETLAWVPGLRLELGFRVDGFSLLMLALVAVAGVAIFGFAASYLPDRARSGRFAGVMTLFAGSMVGLVAADQLLALFIFWELTTVTSYLLIGHDDARPAAKAAALQAALTTGVGGLALLAGLVLLGQAAGTWSMAELLAAPPTGVDAALVLVLIGAFTKSAQAPFHFWLPGAMAAPTPASAFLHSATMVKAGVYLIGRFAPAFATVPWWRPVVVGAGLVTMVIGGWRALRQHDLKILLAHGTVSQLGFLVVLVGFGHPLLTYAGVSLILAHGLFKAALFMVVGTVDHEAGGRDIRKLSGLRRTMPRTFVVASVAAASMAAVPPLLGFVTKEAAFDALLAVAAPWTVVAVVAGASAITVAYSARFVIETFGGRLSPEAAAAHEGGPGLVGWPALLAAASIVFGLLPGPVAAVAGSATASLTGETAGKLVLWPGLKPALALSAAVLAAGALLIWRRRRVEVAQGRLAEVWRRLGTADGGYQAALDGILAGAGRLTGIVQNGSLPAYLIVILMTAVALPVASALLASPPPPATPEIGTPVQWMLAVGIAVASAAIVRARRRFGAVLLLGAVGYGLAALYLIQGAPDLALTQLLVETLTVVLFALVLVRLPDRFEEPAKPPIGTLARVVASLAVAGFVVAGALLAGSARTAPAISEAQIAAAVPEAAGANVVNVILVDFRGFDTLGEITVLVVAALGSAGLVVPLLRRRERT